MKTVLTVSKILTGIPLILSLAVGSASAQKFIIDQSHSQIGFAVKHMMISTVKGNFQKFEGHIFFDAKKIEKSSVEVSLLTASIHTNNEKRDGHLRSGDFFEAEKNPQITFKSSKMEKKDKGYQAQGQLTMRGVSREVTIHFQLVGPIKNDWGKQVLAVEGDLTINRQDYGVSWNKTLDSGGVLVSDSVKIDLNIEAAQE